jgi:hypothetical protein
LLKKGGEPRGLRPSGFHPRLEGVEVNSEGRQRQLKIIQFNRARVLKYGGS